MSNLQSTKMSNKPRSNIASKIPTSGRDSGTHSRSSSVSNLTAASDLHSEIGDATSDNTEDFKIDDRVWVNGTKPGCIKFIGKTQFAAGVWAGVLLDEPVGKNDGSVAGVKYFTCEPLRGIFARPSKLTRTAGAISGIGDSAMVGTLTTPPKPTNVPSSRASVSSNISSPSPKSTKLKVGDRITVSSLSGLKSGTLKFIGETHFAKGEWAGVELDEPTGKNDGSVAGKRYFTCELKYGLFAPLHKVSRLGVTPSRPGSVRGTPLLRSNSRDSLSSSISNSSRASRVKLGITSLTNTQKARVSGSMGISSATKAFEEAIKEKDQHIEQLLKERELDRTEFARLANHFEQVGAKSAELEKKQKLEEAKKKSLEEQLTALQKKSEDIQFQLEEEKIAKTDYEAQLQQRSKILRHIEEYISKESDEKFLNIKEILSGQETLSEIEDAQIVSEESTKLRKKLAELEATVKLLSKEKTEISNHLTELQKGSGENTLMNDSMVKDLNATIQEKDDIITNLKNELNNNIEKVTRLIEDNRNLSEQILLKEEQAKGHADDVIKELGEKINSLSEQLKTQSSQLAEHVTSIEDKDNKIKTLEHNLKEQTDALLQLQNDHKNVSDALKLKELQCEENIDVQKSFEENIMVLKSELETHNDENQKKISLLEEEIKTKSGLLNNYLSSMEEKENLISSLQQNFNSQAASLSQLQNEKRDLTESLNKKDSELSERATKQKVLEEQIAALTAQIDSSTSEGEKKMLDLVKEIERLTNNIQEKEDLLLKTQNELSASHSNIQKLNETIQQLSETVQQTDLSLATSNQEASEKINSLQNELNAFMQEKSDMKSNYERVIADSTNEVESLKKSLDQSNHNLEITIKELELLRVSMNTKEEENNQLTSKLQLAEQKVEMLNKDSSDHVMALQNELSKVKEESTTTKTHLEQELSKIKNDNDKLSVVIKEKDASLLDKEEIVISLEKKLKESDSKISELTAQNTDIMQNISKCNADIEKAKKQEEELSKTLSDFETKLSEKEQELSNVKNNAEELLVTIKEKEKALCEKEEIVTSLQDKLKDKEMAISDLSTQNAELLKNISKFSVELDEGQKIYNEKLSIATVEFDMKLKEKDQVIQDIQNEVKKYAELLENKTTELNNKEGEINVLKNVIKEKESQFDELGKMIEFSQNQLTLLKEQNEKNESLLQNKESFIVDFKTDQEKQLQLKEQSFKEETSKLENLIQSKNEEINSKEVHISNLLKEIEDKKKLIDSLQSDLETTKTDQKKVSDDSKNIYQELNNKVMEMEEKYSKLLEEKEKIAKEELQTRDAKKNLELVRDTLLQEKSAQEELVKDREAKLESLQIEVNRMQAEFSQHKEELQQKLDVSEMELQAALELKNQLDIQHNVLEELQQDLHNSDEKCKALETQVQMVPVLTSEKNQLQAKIDEFQKIIEEKTKMYTKEEEKCLTLAEQLNNTKNLIVQKEKELSTLKEQLQKLPNDKVPSDLSLKSLEDENLALKNKITLLELEKKQPDKSSVTSTKELSPEDDDEKESLNSQIAFLNSIIVDLKQKNEKLTEQLEVQTICWEENDVNLNETKKAIAPRLFCDICEVFDLHETDDCPKQESFATDEDIPQLRRAGTRQLEERPYCNNCEMFGHWTLDCEEPETF